MKQKNISTIEKESNALKILRSCNMKCKTCCFNGPRCEYKKAYKIVKKAFKDLNIYRNKEMLNVK